MEKAEDAMRELYTSRIADKGTRVLRRVRKNNPQDLLQVLYYEWFALREANRSFIKNASVDPDPLQLLAPVFPVIKPLVD